jgi:hypothetical protein
MTIYFPTLDAKPDQEHFVEGSIDNTMMSKSEDGYVFTRPRTTRRPRRKFKTGYTNISDLDKRRLQAFWDQVQGRALAFYWDHPAGLGSYNVRFDMESLQFSYAGWRGGEHRWDISGIELKEV